jgi:hypothetical protein
MVECTSRKEVPRRAKYFAKFFAGLSRRPHRRAFGRKSHACEPLAAGFALGNGAHLVHWNNLHLTAF